MKNAILVFGTALLLPALATAQTAKDYRFVLVPTHESVT